MGWIFSEIMAFFQTWITDILATFMTQLFGGGA
jgi:hypothetical protein